MTLDRWAARLGSACEHVRRDGPRSFRFAPCPSCGGGTRDTDWAREGRAGRVIAGCNGGCGFEDLARALWPPRPGGNAWRRGGAPGRAGDPPRTRPKTRPKGRDALG